MALPIMGILQYTRVNISSGNYIVDADLKNLDEYKWCVETFKLPTDLREWYFNWSWTHPIASFRDQEHALMFTLRWVK